MAAVRSRGTAESRRSGLFGRRLPFVFLPIHQPVLWWNIKAHPMRGAGVKMRTLPTLVSRVLASRRMSQRTGHARIKFIGRWHERRSIRATGCGGPAKFRPTAIAVMQPGPGHVQPCRNMASLACPLTPVAYCPFRGSPEVISHRTIITDHRCGSWIVRRGELGPDGSAGLRAWSRSRLQPLSFSDLQ